MLPLMLKYWREIVMLALLGTIGVLSVSLSLVKKDLITETALKDGITTALNMQSEMIETNRAEYEHNLKIANERKEKVRTEYKTKTEVIYQWGETNATCNDALSYLNNYRF